VWLHFEKRKISLSEEVQTSSRGDDIFQVHQKINDNAYRLDLLVDYGVSLKLMFVI